MNTKKLLCLVSTLAFAAGSVAQAQSLPEVAKAEKARREKLRANGGPAKLYTEGDKTGAAVDASSASASAPSPAGAPGAPAASKSKEKSPEELAAERQKEWTEKVQKAQDEIKQLEEAISRNESSRNSMINITPAKAEMTSRIDADKQKLATLKQTLVDLEDQRRRAGMPRPR